MVKNKERSEATEGVHLCITWCFYLYSNAFFHLHLCVRGEETVKKNHQHRVCDRKWQL